MYMYVERIFSLCGLLTARRRNIMNQNLEMRAFVKLHRMRLKHHQRSQLAEMLLDQSRRASCDCERLPIGDVTQEVKFLSSNYTNPNTNPKALTTLTLTLTDPHGAFESFCAPAFCDFVRNYSCTADVALSHFELN